MTGRLLFLVVASACFALDRVTKLLVRERLEVGERVQLVGDLLELRHVQNRGIAFGLFADSGAVVVAGTLVVGVLLFWFMLHVDPDDQPTMLGASLIAGGAVGNLFDRLSYGYVVDFLHLPAWPTFNVADVAITAGVAVVLLGQLLAVRDDRRAFLARDAEERTADGSEPRR